MPRESGSKSAHPPGTSGNQSQTPSQANGQTRTARESRPNPTIVSDTEIATRNANRSSQLENDNPSVGSNNADTNTTLVAEGHTLPGRPGSNQAATAGSNTEPHDPIRGGHDNPWISSAKSFLGLNRSHPSSNDPHSKRNFLQRPDRTVSRDEQGEEPSENESTYQAELLELLQSLKNEIKRLKEKNVSLKADIKSVNDEFIKVNSENWKLKEENSKFKAQNEIDVNKVRNKLQKAQEKSQREIKQKEEEWKTKLATEREKSKSELQTEKTRFEREKTSLSSQLEASQAKYNTLSTTYDVAIRNSQREIKIRDSEVTRVKEDNQSLRRYIDRMSNAQEPIRGEEKYTQRFEDLNNKITLWVLKQSKLNADVTLHDGNLRSSVLTKLESFGVCGRHAATSIRSSLAQLYASKKTRASLIRHILALFLFDRVFYPFAFALKFPDASAQASDYMKSIENDLFEQG